VFFAITIVLSKYTNSWYKCQVLFERIILVAHNVPRLCAARVSGL
jgi:hypothetical protein